MGGPDGPARYAPLLSQRYVLEVLEGPVAGSGYWWYRVRLASWEDMQLRDGARDGIRSGWIAVANHDGTAWVSRVDVDPGPPRPSLHRGWPAVRRDGTRLRGSPPSLDADGSLALEVTVGGLHPGTALMIVADGDSVIRWQCGSAGAVDTVTTPIASSARTWVHVSVGPEGTATTTLRLLPAPAPLDRCPSGASTVPVVAEFRWADLRVRDPLHRLVLLPEPISRGPTAAASSRARHGHPALDGRGELTEGTRGSTVVACALGTLR